MTCTIYSLDDLLELDSERLRSLANRAHENLTSSRLMFGRCLIALDRNEMACRIGFSNSIHYAAGLGVDGRDAAEMRRIAMSLETLPLLRDAAERGTIGWSNLREVVRRATPETERDWLELAQTSTYRIVERVVSRTEMGERPAEVAEDRGPVEGRVSVVLPMPVMLLWQKAIRELCYRVGRRLPMAEIFECLAMEVLNGSPFPNEADRERILDALARDQAAQAEADEREVRPARDVDPEPGVKAPWAAVAATEVECGGVEVVRPSKPHWGNPRLRPNGAVRVPTEAQRDEVLRRDAYRCCNPGCPNRLWLHVHHVVFYCDGGVTLPCNLITLCWRCHRNLHRGWLRVTGTAPERLIWTDGSGRRLNSS